MHYLSVNALFICLLMRYLFVDGIFCLLLEKGVPTEKLGVCFPLIKINILLKPLCDFPHSFSHESETERGPEHSCVMNTQGS